MSEQYNFEVYCKAFFAELSLRQWLVPYEPTACTVSKNIVKDCPELVLSLPKDDADFCIQSVKSASSLITLFGSGLSMLRVIKL